MKIRFILNPASGHLRRRPGVQDRIAKFIFAHRLAAEVVPTRAVGHATELAAEAVAQGYGLVVAVGGDGTMNEVGRALLNTACTLGLIPCGSGNGLARELGIPLGFDAALRNLLDGRPRLIDSGLADGRPFFVVAGMGFEAQIAHRFNQAKRRGFVQYIAQSARAWWTYRLEDYVIGNDHAAVRTSAFTLAVANCRQYGNNAYIAPRARVDDGVLNAVAIPRLGVLNAPPLLWRLFRQSLTDTPGVVQRSGARLVITRPTPGLVHTDGETFLAPATVEFTVRPRSLRIKVPAATSP